MQQHSDYNRRLFTAKYTILTNSGFLLHNTSKKKPIIRKTHKLMIFEPLFYQLFLDFSVKIE